MYKALRHLPSGRPPLPKTALNIVRFCHILRLIEAFRSSPEHSLIKLTARHYGVIRIFRETFGFWQTNCFYYHGMMTVKTSSSTCGMVSAQKKYRGDHMLIHVMYTGNNFDYVKDFMLGNLIDTGKIARF